MHRKVKTKEVIESEVTAEITSTTIIVLGVERKIWINMKLFFLWLRLQPNVYNQQANEDWINLEVSRMENRYFY